MRNFFIINPNAGKGIFQQSLIEKLKENNIEYFVTSRPGEAKEVAKAEAQKGDDVRIFSCGGEGTNFEVINGIVGFKNASLGIVPCGTGNDFLKFFNNILPFKNLEEQLQGEQYYIDLIKVSDGENTYYGINSCSAGMDAMVCENTVKFKKWPGVSGSGAYCLGVAYTFFQKFGNKIDFIIDGTPFKNIPCLFGVCANAPFYGGGFKCAPTSNPADGILNYSIISTRSRIKTVLMLGKYKKGTHLSLPYCKHGECSTMQYISEQPVTFNIDGEIYKFKNVTCCIVKDALKLSLPKEAVACLKEYAKKA